MSRLNDKSDNVWKNRYIVIFNVVTGVIFIMLFIFSLLPAKQFSYEGEKVIEAGESVSDFVVYDNLSLSPGVYRILLEYEIENDEQAYCTVKDGTVITGGLLTNYEHFYKENGRTDFEVWLFEKGDHVEIRLNTTGNGYVKTGNLTVIKTNRLYTMLMVILFAIWLLGIGIGFYVSYDKKGLISKEKKLTALILFAIFFFASLPYLFGFNISGADLTYHLQRIEGVKDGLLSGQFPVRLESKWLYDQGYADAIFYCNLFLIFPAFLRIMGFPVSFSYNMYSIAVNLATVLISFYCFKKIFKSGKIGVILSGLYTLSVFRIYKLVITSAVGEGTSFTFLPLILYGFYLVFTEDKDNEDKKAWIPITVGLAGILQSHVLTCEITAFVILFICILYINRIFVPKTFFKLLKAAVMTLLVCLWFVVPFLDYYLNEDVHIKHVSARTIQSSGLEIAHLLFNFWSAGQHTASDGNGLYQSHPVGIGFVLVLGGSLFAVLWFSGKLKEKNKEYRFFKTVFVLGIVLMCMSLNIFPWDRLQSLNHILASLISSLQFPNRFLGWGTVCMVTVMGFCLSYVSKVNTKALTGMIFTIVLLTITSSLRLTDYSVYSSNRYELYNTAAMGYGYISGAEYLIEEVDYESLTYEYPVAGENLEVSVYRKKLLGADFICVNDSDTESCIDVPLLLYKGYTAKDVKNGNKLDITYGENGKIRVIIPAHFNGEVNVGFVSPIYWRAAEIISVLAYIVLAFYLIKGKRRSQCAEQITN